MESRSQIVIKNQDLVFWVEEVAALTHPALSTGWMDRKKNMTPYAIKWWSQALSFASMIGYGQAATTRSQIRTMLPGWKTEPLFALFRRTMRAPRITGKSLLKCARS